jgi:hypothetical protein
MAETTKGVRTCIGCSQQSGKRTLFRIVRSSEGAVEFDSTGRKPGRGAYVCSPACFETAFSSRRLQRALKNEVSKEDATRISGEIEEEMQRGERR